MNKTFMAMCSIALGISCARNAPLASQEQAERHEAVQESQNNNTQEPETQGSPAQEAYHAVQPVGIAYAEVWSNAEQLRVSVYGNDIEGNRLWEVRWIRFEDKNTRECLFEQLYAKDDVRIRAVGIWERIISDIRCDGLVDSVAETLNRRSIANQTTWQGINEHMAYARESIFGRFPYYLEEQIEKWHERNTKRMLEKQ